MSPLPGLGLEPAICVLVAIAWMACVVAVVRPDKPFLPTDSIALLSLSGLPLLAGAESASFRYILFMMGVGPLLTGIITYGSRTHRSFLARLLISSTLLASHDQKRYTGPFPLRIGLMGITQALVSGLIIFWINDLNLLAQTGWTGLAQRTVAGVALLLVLPNAVVHIISFVVMIAGWQVRAWHRAPYLSRSLGEFWSERWNLMVPRALGRCVLRPLVKRGWAKWSIVGVFTASAVLHLWLGLTTSSVHTTVPFTLYFVFQVPFALAERPLAVRSWPKWAGRAWTYILVLGPSPMLTEWVVFMVSS